jgi:hypothetical protein
MKVKRLRQSITLAGQITSKKYTRQWAKLGANLMREAVEKVEVWLYEYFNDAFKKESDITDATIINLSINNRIFKNDSSKEVDDVGCATIINSKQKVKQGFSRRFQVSTPARCHGCHG